MYTYKPLLNIKIIPRIRQTLKADGLGQTPKTCLTLSARTPPFRERAWAVSVPLLQTRSLKTGRMRDFKKMTKFSTIFDNFLTSLSKKLLAQLKSRQELQLLMESAVGRFESKTIISKTTTSGCASSSGILEPGFEPTKPFYRS